MLIHIDHMQVEVIKRMMNRKQDGLNALIQKRFDLINSANNQIGSKRLPTLPDETIAQILSHLCWAEDDLILSNDQTTLQRLVADRDTPRFWKSLIEREAPIAIASSGSKSEAVGNAHLVGPAPKLLPMHQSNAVWKDLMEMRKTTIFATLSERPDMDELEGIRQFPWHSLVLTSKEYGSSEDIMKIFMQRFGHELAALDHLDILPSDTYNVVGRSGPVWDPSDGKAFEARIHPAPRLRVVRAPSRLLPCLRPILTNITILDVTIDVGDPQSAAVRARINVLLEGLAHYSNTLTNLTLTNIAYKVRRGNYYFMQGVTRTNPSSTDDHPSVEAAITQVPFSQLTRLKLSFDERTIQNILSAVRSPSLSHLSVTASGLRFTSEIESRNTSFQPPRCMRRSQSSNSSQYGLTLLLYVSRLTHPKEEKQLISQFSTYQLTQFYDTLATVDENGTWLLPKLDSLELQIENLTEDVLLESIGRVAINRLRSAIQSIRFVKVTGLDKFSESPANSLFSKHIDSLKLFVPEVIVRVDRSSDTW